MPQRNRIRFMIGCAAFLGACAGGVGCQTSTVQTVGYPGRTLAVAGPASAPTGTVIASAGPTGQAARPAATIGPAVSVWQPVRRVTAEKPAMLPSGITRVSDPPSTGGTVRASIDIPQPIAVAGGAPPGEPAPHPNEPRLEPQPIVLDPHPIVLDSPHAVFPPPAPHEFAKQPLPPYVVEPPDILLVEATQELTKGFQPIAGQHLVRPDGTISLGTYGSVYLAGLTLNEAHDAVAAQIHTIMTLVSVEDIKKSLVVDVLAYNSKFYYVITDGGGYGEQVYPIQVTGNETVLDALARINGLPPVASKKRIWVARATVDCDHPTILPVDWCGITQRGCIATNWQVFPNDRIYVASDKRIVAESNISKWLNPVDRVLGTVLLGASTVNNIKNRGAGTGTGTGAVP